MWSCMPKGFKPPSDSRRGVTNVPFLRHRQRGLPLSHVIDQQSVAGGCARGTEDCAVMSDRGPGTNGMAAKRIRLPESKIVGGKQMADPKNSYVIARIIGRHRLGQRN